MSAFDIKALQHVIDHDHHELRAKLLEKFRDPLFVPQYNISIDQERKLAYQRLKSICSEAGNISVTDFEGRESGEGSNPLRIFTGSISIQLTIIQQDEASPKMPASGFYPYLFFSAS
jgi:hypothetical protein